MYFRLLLLLLLVASGSAAVAQDDGTEQIGGHLVSFGLLAGYMDFDDGIRFENDLLFGLEATLGFTQWLDLSVTLSQMTMRDRVREDWSSAVIFAMQFRALPWQWRAARFGGLAGVSFMGFEETENTDAISEGLDLGGVLDLDVARGWRLQLDAIWRMQSFSLVPVDLDGIPTGGRSETGYLWSRVLRVGVGRAF